MAKSRHRRKPTTRAARPAGNAKLHAVLEAAHQLMDDGNLTQARALFTELHQRYPDNREALQNLAYVSQQMGDLATYLTHCAELVERFPNDPQLLLALASAYALNNHPALLLRTDRVFLERWPDHPEAERLQKALPEIEAGVLKMISEVGLTGEEGLRIAELHEEVQVCLHANRYTEGRQLALQLIERWPSFAPPYNNLSQLYFMDGMLKEAIETARQVLSFAPDNFQAVANLARMLFLGGQREEAAQMAAKLKTLHSEMPDFWLKQAETFSFLGDDEAVLAAFRGAEQAGALEKLDHAGLLCHLAAVAQLRLGDEQAARDLWEEALDLDPDLELAQANLDDLNRPVAERHGPWAYNFAYYLPRRRAEELITQIKLAGKKPEAIKHAARQFLQANPDIVALAPVLLNRSDMHAAEFLMTLAGATETPELLAALKDFALGQRGSDSLRLRAAHQVSQHGLIPAGEMTIWTQGAWNQVLLINTEITAEMGEWNVPGKARRLAEKGYYELSAGKAGRAEQLFIEALKLAPGDPRLLNNLAQAYNMQGRKDEYRQLRQQIYAEHPDYFFGIVQAAQDHIEHGELEQAQDLLTPLLQQKKLHFSEFATLMTAQIQLYLKQGKRDLARSSFNMLEQVYPDHPNVEALRLSVSPPDFSQLMRKPFGLR